ncbi:MAG: DoxX family protein [Pseudomonadota bacterium]
MHFDSTVQWFDPGLGLPLAELMATLATGAEIGGAILLAIGWPSTGSRYRR